MPPLPQSTANLRSAFETFGDPKLEAMRDAAQLFANEIKSGYPPRWLSLVGKSGVGKTHLAGEIYRWVDRTGCYHEVEGRGGATANVARSYRIVRWRRVAASLLEGNWRELDDLIGYWFLVVDDIGSEHNVPAIKSALERLVDERLNKWTIFTSNLSHRELAELDARIASRMIRGGSVIVEVRDLPDYNNRKRIAA